MLYKLSKTTGDKFAAIDPLPFMGLPREKELEDLLAQNLWDVLFEGNELMPILQERAWQAEADIYALNREGELFIFELKRDDAGGGAVHQALRYCEKAARLTYEDLNRKYRAYMRGAPVELQKEHQVGFDLEHPLEKSAFNRSQHLVVVGSAGDNDLVRNVAYWRSKGLNIDFIPYRVYKLGDDYYFEFFSLPYDLHSNPAKKKGVIFDTNLSYNPDSLWYMCENNRVAAFGGVKGIVHSLGKGDTVFLYHKGHGIVAAGEVRGIVKEDAQTDASYRELKWLTERPTRGAPIKAMPAPEIKRVTRKKFWWPTTMKVPFLNMNEAQTLLEALKPALL